MLMKRTLVVQASIYILDIFPVPPWMSKPRKFEITYGDVKVQKKKLPNGAESLMGVIDIPADTKRRRTSVMNGWYVSRDATSKCVSTSYLVENGSN